MAVSQQELTRLQSAAQKLWDAANQMGALRPRPGTPDWNRWQELVNKAIAANDAYLMALTKSPAF